VLSYVFNLNFSLAGFYGQLEGDAVMQRIVHQLYGLMYPATSTVFEALVDSIVEQQISIKVAHAVEERLCRCFGDKLEVDGQVFSAYPSPRNLVDAGVEGLRGCGLSQRKAEYIYGIAELIVLGKLVLEDLKLQLDSDVVVAQLDALKGVGVWTAELTMLRGMQRLDVLPADDFGIRRVISSFYCGGRSIQAVEARRIAKRWGRWRGLAAFYLIAAEVRGLVV